jgi:GNAT superfamily N-acetyltransferase
VRNLAYFCANASDAPAIARLVADAFATYADWAPPDWSPAGVEEQMRAVLEEWLDRPATWNRVARSDEELAGYVSLRPAYTYDEPREPIAGLAHLWHLFVRREWWGSGLATHLHAKALDEAVRRGFTAARLWTPRNSARARAFYEREGWRATGAEQYAADLDFDVVEYRRILVP